MFQPFSRLSWRDSRAITKNADFLRFCTPQAPQHIVQFYSDDSIVTGNVAFLLGHALDVGESAVIIATQFHLDGIERKFKDAGLDLDAFRRARRYFPVNATELLPKLILDGLPDHPLAIVTSEPTLGAIFDICAEHSITIPAEISL
jgi:hypothetical protein